MFEIEQGVLKSNTKYLKIENRKQAIKKALQIAKKQKCSNVLIVGKGVEEYQIVGSQEADPFQNKISNESPIAAAILGKKLDQVVEVDSPAGIYKIQIVQIA